MTIYTVDEAFKMLKQYGITTHIESVRRWLRNGTIKGIPPTTKKEGWRIREEDLQRFIESRVPSTLKNTTIVVKEEIDEEAIRSAMWWELVRKNIFEGYIEPKKSLVMDCGEHKGYSKDFMKDAWENISQHKRGYRQSRIPYLLDAFLYDGGRIKMDENYESLEEKIIFATLEWLRKKRVKKQ